MKKKKNRDLSVCKEKSFFFFDLRQEIECFVDGGRWESGEDRN